MIGVLVKLGGWLVEGERFGVRDVRSEKQIAAFLSGKSRHDIRVRGAISAGVRTDRRHALPVADLTVQPKTCRPGDSRQRPDQQYTSHARRQTGSLPEHHHQQEQGQHQKTRPGQKRDVRRTTAGLDVEQNGRIVRRPQQIVAGRSLRREIEPHGGPRSSDGVGLDRLLDDIGPADAVVRPHRIGSAGQRNRGGETTADTTFQGELSDLRRSGFGDACRQPPLDPRDGARCGESDGATRRRIAIGINQSVIVELRPACGGQKH
ncbi:MAG: hypothetical protein V9H25_19045 [Candidatus Competibacter sp.]